VRFRRRESLPQSLLDPEKIDLVTQDSSGGANLYVVQDQPWIGSEAETESLEQKLRTYANFALEGQMHEMYPELRGQPWKIILDTYAGPPPKECRERLSALGDVIRDLGGDLIVHEMAIPEPPETVPPTIRAWRVGRKWPEGEPVNL
jgi:uncharacterized protein DUF6572